MKSPPQGAQTRPRGRPTPTVSNHYVPKWYQKRFLTPGRSQFHYLDMRPEPIKGAPPGTRRRALLPFGPENCFAEDHLYSIRLGPWASDMVEHGFFGKIDDEGKAGCEFYSSFSLREGMTEAWHGIMDFICAQRWRTPRGLAFFSKMAKVADRNALLLTLNRVFQTDGTMWTEGIWEIVKVGTGNTRFLLTDNPVTFYNARAFPGAPEMVWPNDAQLGWVGTRTIFPLDLDTCLIITHREFTRNPWKAPRRERINARAYAQCIFNAQEVQTGRVLDEQDVLRINYILKKRADRYIAACDQEWLYPERHISMSWSKLDDDWFLLPNLFELHLGGSIFVGYKGGESAGWDEYGFSREDPNFEKRERDETKNHRLAQREWGAKRLFRSVGTNNHFHQRGKQRPFWDSYVLNEVEEYVRAAKRSGGAEVLERIQAHREVAGAPPESLAGASAMPEAVSRA